MGGDAASSHAVLTASEPRASSAPSTSRPATATI